MVWPRFKTFWFSKDYPTGHSERKKKKRQPEEEMGRQHKEWTGMDFSSSTRAAENRRRWKGIVANSSVVPRRPSKVLDRIEQDRCGVWLCFVILVRYKNRK